VDMHNKVAAIYVMAEAFKKASLHDFISND